jgi:hypothetical protein
MTEPLLILGVHLLKVLHISQKDAYPDHLLNPRPCFVKNGFDVLAALASKFCNRAIDKVAILVGGDLACNPDLAVGFDCLTVGTGRCKGLALKDIRAASVTADEGRVDMPYE